MQKSTPTDPQEENIADLVGHFKNQAQRFVNALDGQNKGTQTTIQYISREIERLRIDKSLPDAPIEYILQAIATNEALIPPLRAKLQRAEKVKEKLVEETNIIFENAIQSLSKSEEEESKEPTLPH
jgi:hypothetical protein